MTLVYHDPLVFQITRPGLDTVRWKKRSVVDGVVEDLTDWSTEGVVEVDDGQYAIDVPIEDTDPLDATYICMDTGDGSPLKRSVKAVNFDPAKLVEVNSGGGILSARIGVSSLTPSGFLEIIQGEAKIITFIIEAVGRFDVQSAETITVKIADNEDTKIEKNTDDDEDEIERVCEEFDVQVIRVFLDAQDIELLVEGVAKIEIAFNSQKARLVQALKILEQIESVES